MPRYDNAQRALHSESAALQGEAGAMAASLAPQRDPERGLVSDLLFYLVGGGRCGALRQVLRPPGCLGGHIPGHVPGAPPRECRPEAEPEGHRSVLAEELACARQPVSLHTFLVDRRRLVAAA